MRWRSGLLSCLVIGGFAAAFAGPAGTEKITTEQAMPRVLRHVVLYEFQNGLPPAAVQQVVDAFSALPSQIDTIVGYEHGTNVSPEGKSDGLTHAFVVTFKNEAGRDVYLKHPAHAAYVEIVKDKREKVVVLDYWTGG